jgi:hypothetical protein
MKEKKPQFEWKGIDLDELRQVMDKPADDAIDAIFESKSIDRLVKILQEMAENDSVISKELPKPVRDFMKRELSIKFTPEDIRYFNQTREIWEEKGTKFILILLFRALPYTYMAEKPANVLRMTKLLKTQPRRRIFETAQFVFDVMEKKWWEPDQRGILTALKVRIMHAAMRQIILDNDYGEIWNDEWGKPISQEDLIATNQVFSLEFFKGMELLGDPLTPEQQEAWFHTWKTIGRIMGVQENLISKNVEEAWSLQLAVYNHLFNDEPVSGIMLTEALVEALDDLYMPLKLVLILMKKMLEDDHYPDCFERMLGPKYEKEFPELFERPETEEQKIDNKNRLREQYHAQLNDYHKILNEKKAGFVKKHPKKGLFENLVAWLVKELNRFNNRKPLIEIHNNKLHQVLHKKEDDNPVEELGEEIMSDSLSALSGIVIGILSLHFREGKNSGFRIPKTLRANWARTGKRKKRWIWNIKSR